MTDNKKGKLIYNDYLSPKYDRMRHANKVLKLIFIAASLTGLVGFIILPGDFLLGLLMVSLIGLCMIVLLERSYYNAISVYENGLEVQCGKPRGGGSHWSVGKKFIPYTEIVSIFHGTDPESPDKGSMPTVFMFILTSIKIRNKDYHGFIPPTSYEDVMPILQERFGEKWKDIYRNPKRLVTVPRVIPNEA